MIKSILLMMLVCVSSLVVAQTVSSRRMTTTIGDYLGQSSELKNFQPLEKGNYKGSEYLHAEWRKGIIIVKGHPKPFSHNKVKIDILNGFIELDMGALGAKILNFSEIDTLYLDSPIGDSQTFVRKNKVRSIYTVEPISEVIFQGPFILLKEYLLLYKEANYNRAMSAGNNYDEAVLSSKLYVVETEVSYELPKKNKEIVKLLSKYYPNADAHYQQHRPRLKDEKVLLNFINLYLEPATPTN